MTEPLFPVPVAAVRNAQAELRTLAGGIDHPECVAWFEGRVYCGTESGQVLAIDPGTGETGMVATPGGFTCGLAFDHQGRCWVCDVGQGRVLRFGPRLGRGGGLGGGRGAAAAQPRTSPRSPATAPSGSPTPAPASGPTTASCSASGPTAGPPSSTVHAAASPTGSPCRRRRTGCISLSRACRGS